VNDFMYMQLRAIIVFMLALAPQVAYSETISEYAIKAAFIYNFARFTEWPVDRDDTSGDTLKVCIYGKDPFKSIIDKIEGKKANNKTIKIVRTNSLKEVKACHIAFLNVIPPQKRLFERVLTKLKGAHVLTISDAADAVDFGVMIGLTVDDENKVKFDINLSSANDEKIKISSKIVNLAIKVKQ